MTATPFRLTKLPFLAMENVLRQCQLPVLIDLSHSSKKMCSTIKTCAIFPTSLDITIKKKAVAVNASNSLWLIQMPDAIGFYPSFNPLVEMEFCGLDVSFIRDDFYNNALYQVYHENPILVVKHLLSFLNSLLRGTVTFNIGFENNSEETAQIAFDELPLTDAKCLNLDNCPVESAEDGKHFLETLNVETFKARDLCVLEKDFQNFFEKWGKQEYENLKYMCIKAVRFQPFEVKEHPLRPRFFVTPLGGALDCFKGYDFVRPDGKVCTILMKPYYTGCHQLHFCVWDRNQVEGPVPRKH